MRPAHFFTVILGSLLVLGTGGVPAEADGHAGGKAASHMSKEGSENNNAQWSTGAERGRARAEERHHLHNRWRGNRHDSADIRGDRLDLKKDKKDIWQDRKDLHQDFHDLRRDTKRGASPQDIARDRQDIRRDLIDLRNDRRDLQNDRRDLRQDLRDY